MLRFLAILALAFIVSALSPILATPAPAHAATCQYVLGFQALHDLIPGIVGDCVVDEHHNPDNGDGLQETVGPTGAGGPLVWRKGDNWTAYTDGYHTWVNGPDGLRERLNTECFNWEAGCTTPLPTTGATLSFTSVVGASPGGTASATIQTSPGAYCRIDYFGPLHHDRYEDGALAPQTAPASGTVTWSWSISSDTPSGQGSVTATCNHATATHSIQIGSTPVTVAFTSVNGAAPGGTASATVQTMAGAVCKIDYMGPQGIDRWEHGALKPDIADSSGVASWSWPISVKTPSGTGTIDVACNGVEASTPIQIGTVTPVTVAFTSVTGAAPGGTASATVVTTPGAACRIDYTGPLGHDRFENGALTPQLANSSGNATWSWFIALDTPAGNGTVNVACNGVSATTTVAIS